MKTIAATIAAAFFVAAIFNPSQLVFPAVAVIILGVLAMFRDGDIGEEERRKHIELEPLEAPHEVPVPVEPEKVPA